MERDDAFRAAVLSEWDRALTHAGIDPTEAHLWLCRGWAGPDGEAPGACYWKPWLDIDDDPGFLSAEQRFEAESDEYRPLHRIAIFEDLYSHDDRFGDTLIPVMGALLRHELEHARQHRYCAQRDDGVMVVHAECLIRAIRAKLAGVPGSVDVFNATPLEHDANAAAGLFLRDHHAEHVAAIRRGPCAYLAPADAPPEPFDTLLPRTVEMLFRFRDVCEREWTIGVLPYLDMYDREAGQLWRALEAGEPREQDAA